MVMQCLCVNLTTLTYSQYIQDNTHKYMHICLQVCRELVSSNLSDESTYATSWYHRYSTSRYTEAAANAADGTGEVNKDVLISKRDSFLTSDQSGGGPDLWGDDDGGGGGVFHCLQWNLDE